MRDMKSQMKDIRMQMEENEDLNVLMSGLRGTNIDQSDFAEQGVEMKVMISINTTMGPTKINYHWYTTPKLLSVIGRNDPVRSFKEHFNSATIGGGFISRLVADFIT